jgi:serine/threonine protein kinase
MTSLGTQARAFAPGDRVDGYRLIAKLGEGGFGVVWRAEQTEPIKREVALKILRPGVDVVAAEERFRMESHALARMNHPGIAAVLDMNVLPGGQPYFVMELVHGEPITRYVEAHQLDLRQRLTLDGGGVSRRAACSSACGAASRSEALEHSRHRS